MSGGGYSYAFRRRFLQGALTLAFLAGPWLKVANVRLFGVDGTSTTLRLFGFPLAAADFFTLLLLTLALLFFLLWIASTMGRFWCGWLCPQSVLAEMKPGVKDGRAKKIGLNLASFCLSLLLAGTFALYFVEPAELLGGEFFPHPGTGVLLLTATALLLYLDMLLVGRGFCRLVCPYGKLLTVLGEAGAYPPGFKADKEKECVECGKCRAVCPMALDPRHGAGPDCLRCGRCLDSCEKVFTSRPGKTGLLSFAPAPAGWFFRPQALLLIGVSLLLALSFAFRLTRGEHPSLRLRAAPEAESRRTGDGRTALFLDAAVTAPPGAYELKAKTFQGKPVEIRGAGGEVIIGPEGRRRLSFALLLEPGTTTVEIGLLTQEGRTLATGRIDLGQSLMENR